MASKMYSVVGTLPTTITHKASTGTFAGELPQTATDDKPDPVVKGGSAEWSNLIKGGLFNFVGKAIVVEALSAVGCTATWSIVDSTGAVVRSTPSAVPFRLSPGEWLKAVTSGASGASSVAVVARQDIPRGL